MKQSFCKRYIAYLKDNPEGYWFKRKLFGWGWTSATREGWLLTVVFIGVILTLAFRLDEKATDMEAITQLLIPIFVLTGIFILIAYKTGEKPRWMFGLPKDDENSDTENE